MEDIQKQMPIVDVDTTEYGVTIEELLQKISHKELKDFVANYAKYNGGFLEKMRLEFLDKMAKEPDTDYAATLRKSMKKVHFSHYDLYEHYEDSLEIEVLDEWLHKAETFVSQGRYNEAIAMLKAIIGEYAAWTETIETEILEQVEYRYRESPFDILTRIAGVDAAMADDLFEYAINEVKSPIYQEAEMLNGFYNMLINIARTPAQIQRYIEVQQELLLNLSDKSSYEAEQILNRIIVGYQKTNENDKVAKVIEENLQINNFRKQYVAQKIAQGDYTVAKKLINDVLSDDNSNYHSKTEWNKMLLTIARKEDDIPTIRKLAYSFIEKRFSVEYYQLFKSTFTSREWPEQLNKILMHYDNNGKYFSESKADVLVEENDAKALMGYIEKKLSIDRLEKYYTYFSKEYPSETLNLFCKTVNSYAENNTGRNHYEYVAKLLSKMKKIAGGSEKVTAMLADFRIRYKNRRAMMEILDSVKI